MTETADWTNLRTKPTFRLIFSSGKDFLTPELKHEEDQRRVSEESKPQDDDFEDMLALITSPFAQIEADLHNARQKRVAVESQVQEESHPKGTEISKGMIIRTAEKYGNRVGYQAEDVFLSRTTHLHLNDKRLTRIGPDLALCSGLRVLYLYGNSLSKIEDLDFGRRLTHLYLQDNIISAIEGMENMVSLKKLYLDRNRIQRVENLGACRRLEELHISQQTLPADVHLEFNQECMEALGEHASCRVINASGNQLLDPTPLAAVPSLTSISLSNNAVSDIKRVLALVSCCAELSTLNMKGCPVLNVPKYRDQVVRASHSLQELDGDSVAPNHREFLIGFEKTKTMRRQPRARAKLEDTVDVWEKAENLGVGKSSNYQAYLNS
ncbi:hypothetical protein BSKO_08208 [Bryopsis sp. KO-2023]|nr:hypothetical protein BSKO_08208 [Bryopsis sp. KO-2023]